MSPKAQSQCISLDRLDHLVLTVRNLEVTCDFYSAVLGMEVITFGQGRKALRFGRQKINLHALGGEFEPKAHKPTAGAGDLCFIVEGPLGQVQAHLQACGIAVEAGPVERSGALGPILSLYLRDPDGNLIELSQYIPSGEKTK
jgi:catechol 2,3-dioxygenase-like lactoylglutathione lyase family enzyme